MYDFKQLRSSLSTVFKGLISVGPVSLVVYARCFVLEVAGSNPAPTLSLFNFFLIFFLFFFLNFSYNYGCI